MTIFKSNTKNNRLLKRKHDAGQLRLLSSGLYTDDLDDNLDNVIKNEISSIVSMLGFTGRLAYGSGLSGGTVDNKLYLVGANYRKWSAYGVEIIQHQQSLEESYEDGVEIHGSGLKKPNLARALVENFSPNLAHKKKSLKNQALLMLESFYNQANLNDRTVFEQNVKAISLKVNPKAWPEIEKEIEKYKLSPVVSVDYKALSIMEKLSTTLNRHDVLPGEASSLSDAALFLECYFSNYIEGTKLSIDDAVNLMKTRSVEKRHYDGHDVVSLRNVMDDDLKNQQVWHTAEEWTLWMKKYHKDFLSHRPEKNPGEFKKIKNYAGSTTFTSPEYVEKTLDRIFEMSMKIATGWKRGCFLKAGFLLVHPFLDGNGRMGRLILNHCLTESKERRLIVPNVYREDYLMGMKALSDGNVGIYVRMMDKVRALTNTATVDADLDICIDLWTKKSAFLDSRDGKWGRVPDENTSKVLNFKI